MRAILQSREWFGLALQSRRVPGRTFDNQPSIRSFSCGCSDLRKPPLGFQLDPVAEPGSLSNGIRLRRALALGEALIMSEADEFPGTLLHPGHTLERGALWPGPTAGRAPVYLG